MFHEIDSLLSDTNNVAYLSGAIYGSLARAAAIQTVSAYLQDMERTETGKNLSDETIEKQRIRENDAEEFLSWAISSCPEVLHPEPTEIVDWLYGERFSKNQGGPLDEVRMQVLESQLSGIIPREEIEQRIEEQREARYHTAMDIRDTLITRLKAALSHARYETYEPPPLKQRKIIDTVISKLEVRKGKALDLVLNGQFVEESIADIHLIEPMLTQAGSLSRRLEQEIAASTEPINNLIH